MPELTELTTNVTAWTLEEPDYQPCPELFEICDAIGAPRLTRSPAELYPTRNPICIHAADGSSRFLFIDTTGPDEGLQIKSQLRRRVSLVVSQQGRHGEMPYATQPISKCYRQTVTPVGARDGSGATADGISSRTRGIRCTPRLTAISVCGSAGG